MLLEIEGCALIKRTSASFAIPVKKYYAECMEAEKGRPVRAFRDTDTDTFIYIIPGKGSDGGNIIKMIEQSQEYLKKFTIRDRNNIPITSAPEKTWPTGRSDIDKWIDKSVTDEQKKLLVGWDGCDENLPAGFFWNDMYLIYLDPSAKHGDISDEEKAEIEAQEEAEKQEEQEKEELPPMPETRCLSTEMHGKYVHEKYADRVEVYNMESGEWVTRYLDGTTREHTESIPEKVKAYAQAAMRITGRNEK